MIYITLILLLTGVDATPRDALLVCAPDRAGETVCEAHVLAYESAIPLEACLAGTAALTAPEAEELSTVLGCSPVGRVLVIDPATIEGY